MTDVNRVITAIPCPDCGFANQITAEHLKDNKPIVCGGCNKIMTLHDPERSVDDYLRAFKAAIEETDLNMKH